MKEIGGMWWERNRGTNENWVFLQAERFEFSAEPLHSALSVLDIIKLWLLDTSLQVFSRLDNSPDCPHSVWRRAPEPNLFVQLSKLGLELFRRKSRRVCRRRRVLEVSDIEVATFFVCWISRGIQKMGSRAMVIGCPFVKVIGNIERRRIRGGVLEINDDYLLIICVKC